MKTKFLITKIAKIFHFTYTAISQNVYISYVSTKYLFGLHMTYCFKIF